MKKKRITTSVTVDPDKDATRRKLGIKLSTAVDLGLDLIFKELLRNKPTVPELIVENPTPQVKPEPTPKPKPKTVDKEFNKNLTQTVTDACERYRISGVLHDHPFEDDRDFQHYINKRAEQVHVSTDTLKQCVLKSVEGTLTPEQLLNISKEELLLLKESDSDE